MNQQKGFSLTEVLVSLLLVTALALALLQQQGQSRQLLNQLLVRAKETQSLDEVSEANSTVMKQQSGFTLSEVLISLFLASIIMTTLTQLYLSCKRNYIEAQHNLETNLDLQWVSELLSDSIRRAGFTPCLGVERLNGALHGLIIENQPRQSIQVNRMSDVFSEVVSIQNPTKILVSDSASFNEKRPVLIADCDHAEVQQISRVDGSQITLSKPLLFSYAATTYIGEWLEEKWFIKNNALYYHLWQSEELTPLIHSLHVITHPRDVGKGDKPLLEITMDLDKNQTHKLKVAVRGS